MSNLASLIRLVWKRLGSSKGLTLSTASGVVAAFAMVIAIPLFSRSVNAQLLREELQELSRRMRRPPFALHIYILDYASDQLTFDIAGQVATYLRDQLGELIDMPITELVTSIRSPDMKVYARQHGLYSAQNDPITTMRFEAVTNIQEHIRIVEGVWPAQTASPEGRIQVVIHQGLAVKMGIHLGEEFLFQERPEEDGIPVRIVGVWTANDEQESFWFSSPRLEYEGSALLSLDGYKEILQPLLIDQVSYASYYVILDQDAAQWQDAPRYASGIRRLFNALQRQIPAARMDYAPLEPLERYIVRSQSLQVTLLTVIAPLVALVLAYLVLMSEISVRRQSQEIATLRSRGSGRFQVVQLTLVEALLYGLFALPASVALAWLAALLMSGVRSFMQFTREVTIPLTLRAEDLAAVGVVWFAILLTRLLPALGAAEHTIVSMKRDQSRPPRKPWWQRAYLDLLSLVPALYGYYVLYNQSGPFVPSWASAEDPFREPLLFLAPSFFALAICMLVVRFFPTLLNILSSRRLARLYPIPAYLSLNQLGRSPASHSGPLLLVMLAMALASYFASVAVTLDTWLVHKVRYQAGADLVITELPPGEALSQTGATSEELEKMELAVRLIPVSEHLNFTHVLGAVRVGRYAGSAMMGMRSQEVEVLALDRRDFPSVSFFRDDFADESLGALMNELALNEAGVLVPRSALARYDLAVGDHIAVSLRQAASAQLAFRVVGVYDYFPTVYPSSVPVLIGNLDYVAMELGTIPSFNIWLHLSTMPALAAFVKEIEQTLHVTALVKWNALQMIRDEQNNPERVGVFGALTLGFLAAGMTSGLGFVLYSYASLRERVIQLGILRAMGVSLLQMIAHVGLEQLILMGFALLGGTAIGLLTSYLYIPFLQVGFQRGQVVPPFQVLVGWWQTIQISVGFGVMLLLALSATVWYLLRLRVFEAIKLGDIG